MAGPTLFQTRRTSVADREANTLTLPTVGEIGVNLTDGRMWVANTTAVFEIGANTKNCRVSNSLFIGNSSVNVTANSTQINTGIIQVTTAAYVGDNVDITTAGWMVGNTTVNVFANSTTVKLANSTVNTSISVPSSAAYTATNYFLHANGSWVQVTGGGGSVPVYQAYTATASQTSFTVSGGYTVGQIEVYVNGVKLARDEYTENGTTVVLDVGAILDSIVEVSGWIALSSYSPTAGGSDTYVQYNDAGPFGGSAGFIFAESTNNVTIANTLTVGTATVNSTLSQQGALNVTNQTNTATLFVTTSANISAGVINSLGIYHTGVMNAATHSVGTSWTANSTLVNANALNCVNQINTATLFVTTSANISSAVINSLGGFHTGTLNAASHTVGTSTIVNSSMVSVTAGSLLSANIQTNPQTGTTYTLAATDSGKVVTCNNASSITVTIPAGLPIGFRTMVMQVNTGVVTLSNTGQTGASIFSRTGAFAITAKWGTASVSEFAANAYVIDGSI